MGTRTAPSVLSFLPATFILALLGWGGLAYVLLMTSPSGGTRWLFFFAGVLALTGTSLPFVAFINRRFPSTPPPSGAVILRQSLWIGIYFPTIAWLQIGRVLTSVLALLLAVGFLLIEWLLRLRERALWRPDGSA